MMNRRNFLRRASMGVTAAAVASQFPEFLLAEPYGKPIGLQLYTLRDQLEKDVSGTLKQVAAIGYRDVEIYSLYGKAPKEFSQILKDSGITASSGHYLLPSLKTNWEKQLEDAKTLGLRYMVLAILDAKDRQSFDDFKRLAELLNKTGEATKKAGLQFCYHNHNFEFTKYGDTTAYEYLLQTLDPNLVKFEMDCFWVTHAGQDPAAYFKKYPGRFPLLHIKDMKDKPAPTQELDAKMGLFAPVGHGTIDWTRIFKAAREGGMEHYYVEQDYCEQPPLEAVKMSYAFLHKLQV
jgi:sugar phosphate isomerase/epimerase